MIYKDLVKRRRIENMFVIKRNCKGKRGQAWKSSQASEKRRCFSVAMYGDGQGLEATGMVMNERQETDNAFLQIFSPVIPTNRDF